MPSDGSSQPPAANIAVVGAGWWTQGWHLPALHHNPRAKLLGIVDISEHPKSNLNPNLESLSVLEKKYNTSIFSSVGSMVEAIGPDLDGVVIATPHATHYQVCEDVVRELYRRQREMGDKHRPLHILMEKPMSTLLEDSRKLLEMVQTNHQSGSKSQFWINHSANYREQAKLARETIAAGKLGTIRHVTGYFASPLKWIFDDPANKGWNEPSPGMLGNGFAWGQSSHLFAFLFHITQLEPIDVYCQMTHSPTTGADVSHSATIRCQSSEQKELAVMSVSRTSLLPDNAHSEPPVPKLVQIVVFGDTASLHYEGNDRDPTSGRLELRQADGTVQVLHPEFHFEDLDNEGNGPESLQSFVQLCCGNMDVYAGADVLDGFKSIQTIDAMYRSRSSRQLEAVIPP